MNMHLKEPEKDTRKKNTMNYGLKEGDRERKRVIERWREREREIMYKI